MQWFHSDTWLSPSFISSENVSRWFHHHWSTCTPCHKSVGYKQTPDRRKRSRRPRIQSQIPQSPLIRPPPRFVRFHRPPSPCTRRLTNMRNCGDLRLKASFWWVQSRLIFASFYLISGFAGSSLSASLHDMTWSHPNGLQQEALSDSLHPTVDRLDQIRLVYNPND